MHFCAQSQENAIYVGLDNAVGHLEAISPESDLHRFCTQGKYPFPLSSVRPLAIQLIILCHVKDTAQGCFFALVTTDRYLVSL